MCTFMIAKKTVWRRAFIVNLALKIQCHIVKNTLGGYKWKNNKWILI